MSKQLTRSILISPSSDESLLEKQRASNADVALLDLEDGVPPDRKEEARERCARVLRDWDYGGKLRWVRVNQVASLDGMRDILAVAAARPDAISPAKPRDREEIIAADYLLTRREEELGLPIGGIGLVPMIETGPAALNLRELIEASPRITGVILGSEDLSAEVGIVRTEEGREMDWIRGNMVLTCHALGVHCYDVASVKLRQPELLYRETRLAYHQGFDGKVCISRGQIDDTHRGFMPEPSELEWAQNILKANHEAETRGEAVFALDDKMVDRPFILQAENILRRAGQHV